MVAQGHLFHFYPVFNPILGDSTKNMTAALEVCRAGSFSTRLREKGEKGDFNLQFLLISAWATITKSRRPCQ